jgi:hypothetical protein
MRVPDLSRGSEPLGPGPKPAWEPEKRINIWPSCIMARPKILIIAGDAVESLEIFYPYFRLKERWTWRLPARRT